MSSFGSLNLGARAIFAAQKGLDLTGQNIANSATPGYSRQRVDQVAVGGPTVPAIWSKYDQTGGGVKVTGVSRMRDEFLEARARTAHQMSAELDETAKTYEAAERIVGEPSNTGLKTRLNDFWASWAAAGKDLKSEAPGKVVVEKGKAVVDEINRQAAAFETQWNDTRVEFDANITEVNKDAADIARLNRAIRNNVINGLPANELADQRDLLVERVTTLTGGVAERAEDGVVNIRLGSNPNDGYLVDGANNWTLKSTGTTDAAAFAVSGQTPPIGVTWDKRYQVGVEDAGAVAPGVTPIPAGVHSALSAQLESMNQVLPDFLKQLDSIAAQFAQTINTQQSNGFTFTTTGGVAGPTLATDGSVATAPTGPGMPAASGLGTAAAPTIRAASLLRFVGQASDLALSKTDPVNKAYDGDNAKEMSAHISDKGGADDMVRTLVVKLGVSASSVYANQKAATNVAKTADDARESVSGVSLNEEMTNLMKYQHSFEAAAKFITAVDATIESLLNMTR